MYPLKKKKDRCFLPFLANTGGHETQFRWVRLSRNLGSRFWKPSEQGQLLLHVPFMPLAPLTFPSWKEDILTEAEGAILQSLTADTSGIIC